MASGEILAQIHGNEAAIAGLRADIAVLQHKIEGQEGALRALRFAVEEVMQELEHRKTQAMAITEVRENAVLAVRFGEKAARDLNEGKLGEIGCTADDMRRQVQAELARHIEALQAKTNTMLQLYNQTTALWTEYGNACAQEQGN